MRKTNKILIISFLAGFYFLNFSLALDQSDCGKFATLSYKQSGNNGFNPVTQSRNTTKNKFTDFLSVEQQNAIIDNDSLNTAMLNLQKYCCEHEYGGLNQNSEVCIEDSVFFNSNALESPYLFDHLFDVMMRRLAGLTGEKHIYEHSNMTVDDKGAERRARITEKAESLGGTTPQIIIDQYVTTRKQSPSDLGYNISSQIYASFEKSDEDLLKLVSGQGDSQESKDIAKALRQYDRWTLYDRYINTCAMSEYFYSLINLGINSNDRATTAHRISNGLCHSAVQTQISAENAYVKLVIQQASNLFLANYIKGYMDYLRGRSNIVRDKQQKIKNGFLDIVNAVPQLVRECVH